MQISTAVSGASDGAAAIAELAAALGCGTGRRPDFLALHFAAGTAAAPLAAAARVRFAGAALHGGSSCLGVMSQRGVSIASGAGVGGLAIWDAAGSYGTASADLGEDAEATARDVAAAAVVAAGRSGEIPDLVWLTVAPGREEQVLAGLRARFGVQTPVYGGSSADNDLSGHWAQFGPDATHRDGVVVSVLYPSAPVFAAYRGGYAPTGASGVVTRIDGRRLAEIDGRPAAAVYRDWTGGAVGAAADAAVPFLQQATFWPLGRVTRQVANVPFHLLAHPAAAHADGTLELFADLAPGDRLWQMRGSADSLVLRAGRVARQARADAGGAISGALVVYCGGCMLALRPRMDEVQDSINKALGGVPWLGIFTFGEQGMPPGGKPEHGNLMISCTVFGR